MMKEIDRKLWLSLNYCNIDKAYFILRDGNFMAKLNVYDDDLAKQHKKAQYIFATEFCGEEGKVER